MTINTQKLRSFASRLSANKTPLAVLMTINAAADAIDAQQAEIDRYRRAAERWKKVAESAEERARDRAAKIVEACGQIEHLDRQNNALRQSLGSMIHAYVRLLDCGRDRILDLGGQCDPLDVLEANDPWLRDARAALSGESNG